MSCMNEFEKTLHDGIVSQFSGLETDEETENCARYMVGKLKDISGGDLVCSRAEQYVEPLSGMLHKETHGIYGSGVFDYPMEEAVRDAKEILGIS